MTLVQFPNPLADRLAKLRSALRDVDTSTMSTAQVADPCNEAVPDCTIDEMVSALRHVGEEHVREAEELKRFQKSRKCPA